jgi:intracellular sulfur oxidation DsrE/DsrF family protein
LYIKKVVDKNNRMTKIESIIIFIKELMNKKFTGRIEIIFNQGGIRGIQKTKTENIDL